jgi:hypothetical protein
MPMFVKGYRGLPPPARGYGSFGATEDNSPDSTVEENPVDPGADVHGGSVPASADQDDSNNLPPEYQGDPVWLDCNGTAQLNSVGFPNTESIRNPYKYVIEVHDIVISCTTQLLQPGFSPGGGSVGLYSSPAAQLGISLSLGDTSLTRNFIPANLMCPGQMLNAESVPYGNGGISTTLIKKAWSTGSLKVKLARTMALMPGEMLNVQFSHLGILQNPITVNLGIRGRLTRKKASDYATRILPFWAPWVGQPMVQPFSSDDPSTAYPSLQSSAETDLQNTTGTQLEVLRFVGRINAVQLYGLISGDATQGKPHDLATDQTTGVLAATEFTDSPIAVDSTHYPQPDALQIQMVKSTGVPVIAPGTPFRGVFDAFTRSWEVDDVLQDNAYYVATVALQPPNEDNTAAGQQNPIYPQIGMYGQREVSL